MIQAIGGNVGGSELAVRDANRGDDVKGDSNEILVVEVSGRPAFDDKGLNEADPDDGVWVEAGLPWLAFDGGTDGQGAIGADASVTGDEGFDGPRR